MLEGARRLMVLASLGVGLLGQPCQASASPPIPTGSSKPTLDDPGLGPVEGPQRPPEPEPEPEPEMPQPPTPTYDAPAEPGITFAVPPPEPEPAPRTPNRDRALAAPRNPGTAPPDGAGLLVTGGVGLPLAAFAGWLFVSQAGLTPLNPDHRGEIVGISVAAGGVGLIGLGTLAVGSLRRYRNLRWARANRVIAVPQGRGLLTGGGFALAAPVAFIPIGLGLPVAAGAPMIATSVALAAIGGPIMLVIGARRAQAYRAHGGWRARAQHVNLQPTFTPTVAPAPGGLSLGVAGRF